MNTFIVKDLILSSVKMADILQRYGIIARKNFFNCPFHNDKNASAKVYQNSFYCFGCGAKGDVISFVQQYYNLNFKEAMQKINIDFGLNLDVSGKVDFKKIEAIQQQRLLTEQKKQNLIQKYISLCDKRHILCKSIKQISNSITQENWEVQEYRRSKLLMQLESLDFKIDKINEDISIL